jgi:hypothetical protein
VMELGFKPRQSALGSTLSHYIIELLKGSAGRNIKCASVSLSSAECKGMNRKLV